MTKHLSGSTTPDLELNFHETAGGRICNSGRQWAELAVNDDGTIKPPAHYAMRVTIGFFSKIYGKSDIPFEKTFIVGPSQSMISQMAGASVSETLMVPMTLTVLRQFME